MFSPRSDNQVRKPGGYRLHRSDPALGGKPPKQNLAWRTLALNTTGIQRKLSTSQAGDSYEREADSIANQVMRTPGPQLQQTCACGGGGCSECRKAPHNHSNAVPPIVPEAAVHSSGQPLDPSTRGLMESRMGHDFSDVRVHTDEHANEAASAIDARAFTLGRDIVFGSGEYGPATTKGNQLLAHELAHVVQQSGNTSESASFVGPTIQREATTEGKPAQDPEELVAGSLWAKDAAGKDLPPSLDDISQGGVGDCYLFAAMAAVANTKPEKIVNMIKDNGNGTYTVKFQGIGFISSAQQTVTASFPVGKHGNVTARKALWPLVIEKAYGQQKGGIEVVGKGGNPGTVIDELLDDGPSRFDPREKTADFIMGKLAKAKEKKWPMVFSGPKKEGAGKEKKAMADNTSGLYFNHGYPIIDIDPLKNRVKLFNPWGHDHPNGDGWMDIEQTRKFFIEVSIND